MSRDLVLTSPGNSISGWKITKKLSRLKGTGGSATAARENLLFIAFDLSNFGKSKIGIINLEISNNGSEYRATGLAVLLAKK